MSKQKEFDEAVYEDARERGESHEAAVAAAFGEESSKKKKLCYF